MAKFAVIVEQAADGGWSAYSDVCGSIIGGLGDSRELAIADWKEAMGYWLNYRREKGEQVVIPDVEVARMCNGYPVVLAETKSGTWSAHSVDLPVIATGKTLEEVRRNITEGIEVWMEETLKDGMEIPAPSVVNGPDVEVVEVGG